MLFITIKYLLLYIRQRFPFVLILIPTLLNVNVLYRLLDIEFGRHFWGIILFTMTLYFGIRVLDDERDFEYDKNHHKERVLQHGVISINHLNVIKLSLYLIVSYVTSPALLIVYAIVEIFLRAISKLSEYFNIFWLKNFVLSLGNAGVLLAVYSIVFYQLDWNNHYLLMLQHFVISFMGSYLLELTRKIDVSEVDGYRRNTNLLVLQWLLAAPIISVLFVSYEWYLLPLTCILIWSIFQQKYRLIKNLTYFYYIFSLIFMLI